MKIRLIMLGALLSMAAFFWFGRGLCAPPHAAMAATEGNDGSEPKAGPVALINGKIIDGTGRAPIDNGVILTDGGKIIDVGKVDEIAIPAGYEVIDVRGAAILPGLVNAHAHEAYNPVHASLWASCGITTVRDLHCDRRKLAQTIAFRDQARTNPLHCRIVSAGSLITVPWGYKAGAGSITVNSEKQAREKVGAELDAGVDFVKIVLQRPKFPQLANLSPALAKYIVTLAHGRGVPVTVHVGTAEDLRAALDSGADDIAHIVADELPPDLIARMVREEIYLEPTLTDWAEARERPTVLANFRRYVKAGGRVALGAEHIPAARYKGPFIGMPLTELLMMQEAGMTPMEIITASTKNAAFVCRLDRILGTLEKGKIADILVLDGDPLADLRCFAKTKIVIHDGVLIKKR